MSVFNVSISPVIQAQVFTRVFYGINVSIYDQAFCLQHILLSYFVKKHFDFNTFYY